MKNLFKFSLKAIIVAFAAVIGFYMQANAATCDVSLDASGDWKVTQSCSFETSCKIPGNIIFDTSSAPFTITLTGTTTLGIDLATYSIRFGSGSNGGKILLDPTKSSIKKLDSLPDCKPATLDICTAGGTVPCTIMTPTPINGFCGTASGTTVSTIPTTNLCTSGTATSVSGTGPWNWSCTGSNGGSNASCSANKSTTTGCDAPDITLSKNGQVWSACNVGTTTAGMESASYGGYYTYDNSLGMCPSGYKQPSQSDWQSAYDAYPNQTLGNADNIATKLKLPLAGGYNSGYFSQGRYAYYWSSTPVDSTHAFSLYFSSSTFKSASVERRYYGYPVRCIKNAPTPINGSCGTANGTTVTSTSPSNLCADGSLPTVSGDGPLTWTCAGSNGGTDASCKAELSCAAAPDIELSNGQFWKACNVGASVVGTGTNSTGSGFYYGGACPSGYKTPSKDDWKAACDNISGTNCTDNSVTSKKMQNTLKLTSSPDIYSAGDYWTSSRSGGGDCSPGTYTQWNDNFVAGFSDTNFSIYVAGLDACYDQNQVRCIRN